MFGKDQVCASCRKWQRDGGDGICRARPPVPAIYENGKSYVIVWPRTNAHDWCGDFSAYEPEDTVQ